MHVAHFVHRYPPAVGGAEAYFARLARYLHECGDTVDTWTTTAVRLEEFWSPSPRDPVGRVEEALRRGPTARQPLIAMPSGLADSTRPTKSSPGRIHHYPPLTFPLRRYALKALSLLPLPRLQALALPCNPVCPAMWRDAGRYAGPLDAVHATAFPYSFPIACGLRLARRRGVPFLLTPFLHLGDPSDPADRTRRQYTRPALRWLLHQADRVFVQTPTEFRAAVALGVPERRLVLQGLGVDRADFSAGNRAAKSSRDEVVVGHLANASVEKGTVDLLRAAAKCWAAGQRFRVVLAGPDMPNFRRFWDTFPHQANVTRLGVLSDTQKRDFFAGIDLFALPSRSDSFGLVLLEAWASGKPNLCYRAGGPADLIRDGEDGLLAKCGDVEELAAKLGRLVADGELRRRLGDAGRRRVGAEFRWEDKLRLVREATVEAVEERRAAGLDPAGGLAEKKDGRDEPGRSPDPFSLHLQHHEVALPRRPQGL